MALLPELEGLRGEAEPSPVARHGQLTISVLALEVIDAALELPATVEPLALRRGQRAELAAAGPRTNVRRRLRGARALNRSLNSHLPPERIPMKEQRGARVGRNLEPLAAGVV